MAAPATCFTQPAYDHDRIARYMKGAESRHVSDALMREIYLRDNGTCQKCSRPVGPRAAHFDHIIPWSEDGDTVPWNLQILCESCNLAKGNRMDRQDYAKLFELQSFVWWAHVLLACFDSPEAALVGKDELRAARRSAVQTLRDVADALEQGIDKESGQLPGSGQLRGDRCVADLDGIDAARTGNRRERPAVTRDAPRDFLQLEKMETAT